MRVHELAESLGVAKSDLGEFLEGLGEKGHHLSHVSAEAELLARDHFVVVPPENLPYADEQTTWEAFNADPATDEDQAEFIETMEWLRSIDGEVREIDTPGIDPELPAATGDHVPVPEADRIALLADNGVYRGTLCLDPSTAEKLREALKGRSVADATLHPERGELVAVTWPDYQKLVVRLDE